MAMKHSFITSIVSNRYHVYHEGAIVEAIARGRLRLKDKPRVGDWVYLEEDDDGNVLIDRILPRKNVLTRPFVANVDQALIVTSMREPNFSYQLLDRLLFLVSYENIKPVVIISKTDLVSEEEVREVVSEYEDVYPVYTTGLNDDAFDIESILKDKISVLAGQSGVGKSSILNRINPDFSLRTQAISKALGRGRHTTRHNELFQLGEGWIADTPGFSSLDFKHLDPFTFAQSVEDFKPYLGECRYRDCLHLSEPSCSIKAHIETGDISKKRYEHYVDIQNQIKGETF